MAEGINLSVDRYVGTLHATSLHTTYLIKFQNCQECLLRNFNISNLPHTLLPFLLFLKDELELSFAAVYIDSRVLLCETQVL